MGKIGSVLVICAAGVILLAVPIVLSVAKVEADVINFSIVVGVCIVLVAAIYQASSLVLRHSSQTQESTETTELSLNQVSDQSKE